jgi:hypothetical protein
VAAGNHYEHTKNARKHQHVELASVIERLQPAGSRKRNEQKTNVKDILLKGNKSASSKEVIEEVSIHHREEAYNEIGQQQHVNYVKKGVSLLIEAVKVKYKQRYDD